MGKRLGKSRAVRLHARASQLWCSSWLPTLFCLFLMDINAVPRRFTMDEFKYMKTALLAIVALSDHQSRTQANDLIEEVEVSYPSGTQHSHYHAQ